MAVCCCEDQRFRGRSFQLLGAYNSVFEEKYFAPVLLNGVPQIWIIKPDSLDHFRLIETLLESTKLMEQEPEGFEFDVRTKLCDVWRIFLGDTKEIRLRAPARNVADTERLKQMMDFIETHYAENISVSDIAAAAGISTRESTRCFQRCISLLPVSYLSDYRVRMAAKLLRTTGKTVIEVSEACDGCIRRLTGTMGGNRCVACIVSHLDSFQRFRYRTDLIELNQNRVGSSKGNALRKAFRVGDEQIIAYQLDFMTNLLCHPLPAFPVFFIQSIFNGDDRILVYDGYVLTAMRVVNAIPAVCKAKGGIVTIHDIPEYLPSGAFRSDATFIDHKVSKA